jgi:hypothetical protein
MDIQGEDQDGILDVIPEDEEIGPDLPEEEELETEEDEPQPKERLSDEDFSKETRKRIGREVKKRKVMEDDFAEKTKSLTRRIKELEESHTESEISRIDQNEASLKERYQEALEEDNGEADAILEQMTEQKVRRKEMQGRKDSQPETEEEVAPGMHPAAAKFLEDHEELLEDPAIHGHVVEMEAELREDGGKIGYGLYRKLAKMVGDEYGDNKDAGNETEDTEDDEPKPRQRRGSAVTAQSRSSGRKARTTNHLTAHDKQVLENVGLDPTDPEVIKAHLATKAKRA